VRMLWLFLLGAALGALVGLAGILLRGDLDWLATVPIGGVLLAIEPLQIIWLKQKGAERGRSRDATGRSIFGGGCR
jgi:hypothetical protein